MHANKKIHHFTPGNAFCDSLIINNPDPAATPDKKYFLRVDHHLSQVQRDSIYTALNTLKQDCIDYDNTIDVTALNIEISKIES